MAEAFTWIRMYLAFWLTSMQRGGEKIRMFLGAHGSGLPSHSTDHSVAFPMYVAALEIRHTAPGLNTSYIDTLDTYTGSGYSTVKNSSSPVSDDGSHPAMLSP
eukprot:CAMPEP_0177754074 /NCGR_PEP_ID=MMETSP0491_2-20121128/1810_1 /TAXON_ID=63592 /ORGANISM="Tetraselmis chuii, Strain PLY429" /LENGTH=102 /DNA_ID=CAMNT_0019269423 /DNA_START=688 /DNA_END=996 /DNA_ORIENTATION=+